MIPEEEDRRSAAFIVWLMTTKALSDKLRDAICKDDAEQVRILARRYKELAPNWQMPFDSREFSFMHTAAIQGAQRSLPVLHEEGFDIDIADRHFKTTPLGQIMLGLTNGLTEPVKLALANELISRGADPKRAVRSFKKTVAEIGDPELRVAVQQAAARLHPPSVFAKLMRATFA